MSNQCKLCGSKTFGNEFDPGLCEYCALDREAVRPLLPRDFGDDGVDDDSLRLGQRLYERRRGGPQWLKFKTGLSLHIACSVCMLLSPLMGLFFAFMDARHMGDRPRPADGLFVVTSCWSGVVGILWLMGSGSLCNVPREARLTALAWTNMGCLLGGIAWFVLMAFFAALLSSHEYSPLAGSIFSGGTFCLYPVLMLSSGIAYALLLNGVARHFGDFELARGFVAFFISALVLPIIVMVLGFYTMFHIAYDGVGLGRWDFLPFLGVLGAGLLMVILPVWFITLLARLRSLLE